MEKTVMNNPKSLGVKCLQKGFILVLMSVILTTMLPLMGMMISLNNQSDLPTLLSEFAVHAESSRASGNAGNSIKWRFSSSNGELIISGSGSMWDWEDPFDEASSKIAPWFILRDRIQTITIQSGVDYIGSYAFAGCEAANTVSIPDTVGDIMKGAFQGCSSLKSVSIPGNVLSLGSYSFAYCDSLKTINIPKSVRIFHAESFYDCEKLESITVEDGNDLFKDIDGVVFTKMGALSIYPSGKKDHVYYVPEGTIGILTGAFLCNDYIRAIVYPESTKQISFESMQDNENLLRIFIQKEMDYIDRRAIVLCPSLMDIYYGGTELQKAQIQIETSNESLMNAEWHYNTMPEDMLIALFGDVPKTAYYYESVNWAARAGITSGTSDVTFSPEDPCTRGQVVTLLWRANGSKKITDVENPFKDVKSDDYYYDAVLWAYKNGITAGTTATTFSPDSTCNRGQIVTFLWRTVDKPDSSAKVSFTDVSSGAFYYDAVKWAVEKEVTKGTAETTFSPSADCTRGQIVTFLHRALANNN